MLNHSWYVQRHPYEVIKREAFKEYGRTLQRVYFRFWIFEDKYIGAVELPISPSVLLPLGQEHDAIQESIYQTKRYPRMYPERISEVSSN